VLRLVANEVETWAPSHLESKICHLAVMEVAQRLEQRLTNEQQRLGQSSQRRQLPHALA
jgi:hypothetical protein